MTFPSLKLDLASLKVRLTLGIAVFSTLGLGGLASWTSVRMQHLLVSTHKENIKYIAERFPQDVEVYSDMMPPATGAQRAIASLSDERILMWVKSDRSEIIARSQRLLESPNIAEVLLPLKNVPTIPQVRDLNGRYWLLCATPLKAAETNLGTFYIAQDITQDQKMLMGLLRSLSIATIIVTTMIIIAIAWYIDRSLQPLKRMSKLTSNISAERLNEVHLDLENPPTEVKELAETFEEMLSRLSQSWEHQRSLLSNVSHELRTPLTIICGYLESTLRRGNNLTEIQKEALTTAAGEADRTVQLLRDLLDLARVDSGAMHFQKETVCVNELLIEVVEMTKQYSNHPMKFDLASNKLGISCDRNRLKQVFLNLIDNAIKYSAPEKPILVKSYVKDDSVFVEVCDCGVGIPLQQQARIFERFYRLDEARHRAGGTGLGLSIVKTLVEGMGGKISVQSQPDIGSTFTLSFARILSN